MRRFRLAGFVVVPALMLALVGCGGGGDTPKPPSGGGPKPGAGADNKETPKDTGSAAAKGPIKSNETGVLVGKVVYDGAPPSPDALKIDASNPQKDFCEKNDPKDNLWVVDGATKGVKNVVVWVRAPKGAYFDLNDAQKKQRGNVTVDQPKCTFEPRVAAYFASYYDGKKQAPSGNKLAVANSATFNHNTGTQYSDPLAGNTPVNQILSPKGNMDVPVKVSKEEAMGGELLTSLGCNIHPWMSGKVAVFDHPFFAVTNEKGEFKIENVPAGVELELVYWHESMGPTSLKSGKANKLSVKAGENKQDDIKIKK